MISHTSQWTKRLDLGSAEFKGGPPEIGVERPLEQRRSGDRLFRRARSRCLVALLNEAFFPCADRG